MVTDRVQIMNSISLLGKLLSQNVVAERRGHCGTKFVLIVPCEVAIRDVELMDVSVFQLAGARR